MAKTDTAAADTLAAVETPVEVQPDPVVEAAPAAPAPVTAVVVANGKIPAGSAGLIVLAESRSDNGEADSATYDAGGAYYLRMTADLDMKCDASKQMTLGGNLQQYAFGGFAPNSQAVNVGPAHPAFAAVNFAYNIGARDITVTGLSDFWKAKLQPYFDDVNGRAEYGVSVRVV